MGYDSMKQNFLRASALFALFVVSGCENMTPEDAALLNSVLFGSVAIAGDVASEYPKTYTYPQQVYRSAPRVNITCNPNVYGGFYCT
jgi:hypothetical protein